MTAPTRPEPVLRLGQLVANWSKFQAAVIACVVAGGGVAVTIGRATDGQVQQAAYLTSGILGGVGTLLGILLPLLGARTATAAAAVVREQVTPLVSPRNADLHALVDAVEVYGRHAGMPTDGEDAAASMGPDLP